MSLASFKTPFHQGNGYYKHTGVFIDLMKHLKAVYQGLCVSKNKTVFLSTEKQNSSCGV